jgi:hydrogenase maturation protein HypF
MAEHSLEGPVIGLSLDGTGYGTDGHIWGGEVLIARLDSFERFAHLAYVPMPGGESAIREPWRMAFGHLIAAGFSVDEAEKLAGASPQEARLLARMIERRLNTPLTSSLGRLFDAVAAVVLKRREVDYEAQAAIELEGCAIHEDDDVGRSEYALELWDGGKLDGSNVIRTNRMWKTLLTDLRCGEDLSRIAARFHAGVAEGLINAVANARIENGLNRVVLSGGCLHNRRLARLMRAGLEEEGFQVFTQRNVSPGDGGLSYGQAVVAAAILRNREKQAER